MPELVRATMLTAFLAFGYDAPHAQALFRYVESESGFQPYVVARTGSCLFQWVGSRRRDLYAFAGIRSGCPPLKVQLAFADHELHSPAYACFWTAPRGQEYAVLNRTFRRGGRC